MTLNVLTLGPGTGRPVLALHGVTGHAGRFRGLAARLPALRVHAVDLRGHGRSSWTPPWSIEQHVVDVLATLDALGLPRVPVVGHSFGGAVALHLARAAPERVERLVLVDPALGLDPALMLENATLACTDESFLDRESARVDRAARWEGVPDEAVEAELDDHLDERGGRLRYRYSRPAVVAAWSEMARPAVTPPPGTPTLLLPAARVDFVRPEWVERMRAELGPALEVRAMDTGHMVYLERPAETAAAIGAFLHG